MHGLHAVVPPAPSMRCLCVSATLPAPPAAPCRRSAARRALQQDILDEPIDTSDSSINQYEEGLCIQLSNKCSRALSVTMRFNFDPFHEGWALMRPSDPLSLNGCLNEDPTGSGECVRRKLLGGATAQFSSDSRACAPVDSIWDLYVTVYPETIPPRNSSGQAYSEEIIFSSTDLIGNPCTEQSAGCPVAWYKVSNAASRLG